MPVKKKRIRKSDRTKKQPLHGKILGLQSDHPRLVVWLLILYSLPGSYLFCSTRQCVKPDSTDAFRSSLTKFSPARNVCSSSLLHPITPQLKYD